MDLSNRFILLIIAVLMVSCASEQKITYEKGGKEKFGERYMSDVKMVVDEQGNVRPNKDKRSQFESTGNFAGAKDVKGSTYGKKAYDSKRWGGNKGFNSKAYAGHKDGSRYKKSPHFVQQQARAQGQQVALGTDQYGTNGYQKVGSNVAPSGRAMARPSDAKVNKRRSVYRAPEIYNSDQVNGIDINDTRSMLGR